MEGSTARELRITGSLVLLPGQGLEPHHETRVATNLGLGGLLGLGVGSCGEVGSYQMNQLLQIVFLWI